MHTRRLVSSRKHVVAFGFALTLASGLSAPFSPAASAADAPIPVGAVELSPTPPNDTQAVAPNIVVTSDDSGSMANNYMGDNSPYNNGSWSGPWRCAGVIDPRIASSGDIRASAMNGVYYNPNVLYAPPVRADGSVFPQADSTLKVTALDGIGVNRPYNQKALDTVGGYNDNPNGSFDTTAATDLTGTKQTLGPGTGWYWNGVGSYTTYANWVYGTYPTGNGWYSNNAKGTRPSKTGDLVNGSYPTTNLGDKRWKCGYDATSPMDSSKKGPDGNSYPDGGPYYYRLKSGTTIAVDGYGRPTTSGTGNGSSTLYTVANWEAVAVPNSNAIINGVTVNQWQNFANWYAYYRVRNLMTRTALSRVFGSLGSSTPTGGYGNAFRVAWQNLYTSGTFSLQDNTIITSLLDLNSPACNASSVDPSKVSLQGTTPFRTAPNCYRSAFFNWIFSVNATSDTPARASAIRAGKFFQRGYNSGNKVGNTGATGDLHDPYWDPPQKTGADGSELVCRQNFHMLVTDGYWNEGNPGLPTGFVDSQTASTLPDGTKYSVTAAESRVFWNVQGTKLQSSQANIAFNYWATNLRPDLYDPTNGKIVPPYMPDTTAGVVTGATSAALEKYFNPNNDPANWPHMVEYMVTLGVPGKLTYSDDVDCIKSASNDICSLRQGQKNSSGNVGWTTPANSAAEGIDDTWHAAINSRGAYFNAGNPQNLVDQLSSILTNISARSAPATTAAVNTAVLVPGALGFSTGYSSADWTGTLQAVSVDADGTTSPASSWDAGALLDDATKTPPGSRSIFTAKAAADGSFAGGVAFKAFTDLDTAGRALLSGAPASSDPANDTGQTRVDYLRGDRTKEATTFRQRTHLLGAIIGSQALYVTYPSSGYRNTWPANSPEQDAVAADGANCGSTTPSTCNSYEYFVKDNLTRKPVVYVGANDGMLHAFDASVYEDTSVTPSVVKPAAGAGKELFAYVPRSVYANLGNLMAKSNFKFLPTVDGIPVTSDVFFSVGTTSPVITSKGWHSILVGSLRLGGRGVYALDITDPTAMGAGKVLWEFNADMPDDASTGGKPSNLGYTYGQPNIGRLNNSKWVVLVPGGYFPDCSKAPFTSANCTAPVAASNKFSSLFVLDAQTGKLIREFRTSDSAASGTVFSHGLSTPVLGDYNDDQIDDVAFAGDLDGNLWRFDLADANPANWTVTLTYKPSTALAGKQPITSMPRLFGDPATNKFIVVFGTGKYLGAGDNTSGSSAQQAVYGIRDVGSTVTPSDLVQQTLSEKTATDGKTVARGVTDYPIGTGMKGWYLNLGPSTSSEGERVVVTPGALFDTGRVVVQTLIPGTNDPCDASIQGAIIVLNAATGGSGGGLTGPGVAGWGGTGQGDTSTVGGRVNNPRTTGSVPLVATIGGGSVLIPGLKLSGSGSVLNINDAIWRRRSWRVLNND